MSNKLAHSFILEVIFSSAKLGFKFPDGWLWLIIIAEALHLSITEKSSLTSTTVPAG